MKTTSNILTSSTLLIVSLLLCATSCKKIEVSTTTSQSVVSIGEYTLTLDELKSIVPVGTSPQDSTTIVDGYIRRWATDILLYEKAKKNVHNSDEIKRLVEDYQRSLTIHYYQQNMMSEKVSQPTTTESKQYYQTHQNEFTLSRAVMKGFIIQMPSKKKQVNTIRKKIKRYKEDNNLQSIEKYALQHASQYTIFVDRWLSEEEITKDDKVNFEQVQGTGYYEFADSTSTTLLKITNYAPIGTTTPEELAIETAKQKLYNQRKMDFLRNFGLELYEESKKNREIIIHSIEER